MIYCYCKDGTENSNEHTLFKAEKKMITYILLHVIPQIKSRMLILDFLANFLSVTIQLHMYIAETG